MPTLIAKPAVIRAAGNKPKEIQEFAGRANTGHADLSVARMLSPEGWREPGQRPEFQEITVVLRGMVRVDYEGGTLEVRAGQGVVTQPGEWVRYSTPEPGGAEYLAACTPAFAPTTVHPDLESAQVRVRGGRQTTRCTPPRWEEAEPVERLRGFRNRGSHPER